MNEFIPISKFIKHGFDSFGDGFWLILIGIIFLMRSNLIFWPSKLQKKALAEYYSAKKENKKITSSQEYTGLLVFSNRAGWLFILLGVLYSIFSGIGFNF